MLRSAELELRSVRKLFLEEQVAYCWLIKGFRRGARGWQTEMEAAWCATCSSKDFQLETLAQPSPELEHWTGTQQPEPPPVSE